MAEKSRTCAACLQIHQTLSELLLQAGGPFAQQGGPVGARYLNLRKFTIYGGSNEIQRNIYAKVTLGL